ncbi:MAG: DUF3684 domain-containing protein, partial [Verrucomicrobiaceae bacterium]
MILIHPDLIWNTHLATKIRSYGFFDYETNAGLKLSFTPSPRLEILQRYLNKVCHDSDPKLFISTGIAPTETEVLEAIGWSPSSTGGVTRNWEDEQWETSEVKDDLESIMSKAAKTGDAKQYETAMLYFVANHYSNGYRRFPIESVTVPFLPLAG